MGTYALIRLPVERGSLPIGIINRCKKIDCWCWRIEYSHLWKIGFLKKRSSVSKFGNLMAGPLRFRFWQLRIGSNKNRIANNRFKIPILRPNESIFSRMQSESNIPRPATNQSVAIERAPEHNEIQAQLPAPVINADQARENPPVNNNAPIGNPV